MIRFLTIYNVAVGIRVVNIFTYSIPLNSSLHRVLPTTTGIDACGISELFQAGHLLGSQLNLGSLCSLDDVTILGGSDDGHRSLGDSPGNAYL